VELEMAVDWWGVSLKARFDNPSAYEFVSRQLYIGIANICITRIQIPKTKMNISRRYD